MRSIRAWVRNFFGFSRTETNGFLVLLPLLLIVLFAEPIYQAWFTSQPINFSSDIRKLDSIVSTWKYEKADSTVHSIKAAKIFEFNPNTISSKEFTELGFKENIANRIVSYRQKGGKFRIKADLKKIFGIDTALVIKLYPFITLPDKFEKTESVIKVDKVKKPELTKPEIKDINKADTTQLILLKGIGSKLSARIIKYRERLGGFVSKEQYSEVYGLDSAVLAELKNKTFIASDFIPKQININKAKEKELITLPYIKFQLAKAIIAYRFQHGNFNSVDEVSKIALIDSSIFEKIKPYLTVKEQ